MQIRKIAGLGLLLFFMSIGLQGFAQRLPDVESLLENNGIESTEDGYEDIVATLLDLAARPLNINSAGFDSLKMLYFLSDSQIDHLLAFRRQFGKFNHPSELMLVLGFGQQDVDNILPFIVCGESDERSVPTFYRRQRHEVIARAYTTLPRQEGYRFYSPQEFDTERDYEVKRRNRFQGPPVGTLLKYKFTRSDHLQAGISLANDPGEGYFTRHQPLGFDFLSVHFKIAGKGILHQFLLGDYRVQWGQGLVAWGGFTSGKSDMAASHEKAGKGFTPYTSTDENKYLRGLAVSLTPSERLFLDFFASFKKTDATLTAADTLAEEDYLSASLYESGYHRNANECDKKHRLKTWTSGISLQWHHPWYRITANALYYNFSPGLIPGKQAYQQLNEDGKNRLLLSLDYKINFRDFCFFGETAWGKDSDWATLNGLRYTKEWFSGSLLYRRYGERYRSYYASGFSEFGNTANEEGFYCGVELTFSEKFTCSLYGDCFRFFAPRYQATLPGTGWEVFGKAVYLHSIFQHTLRYKREVRPENGKQEAQAFRTKQEIRYQLDCMPTERWELRTRLSFSFYDKEEVSEQGVMAYQDIIYAALERKFKLQYRFAWFHTDSYNSRIYAYENNVLYGYSFPSFMGKGWRTYLNLNWRPIRHLTCYFKSGLTIYPGRESVSSGLTETEGNKRYDLTLQIRWTF